MSSVPDFGNASADRPDPFMRLLNHLWQPVRGVASHTNGNLAGGALFWAIEAGAAVKKATDIVYRKHAFAPVHALHNGSEMALATVAAATGLTVVASCAYSAIAPYLREGEKARARPKAAAVPKASQQFNPFSRKAAQIVPG
jgi:hypothetical protein